MSELAQQVGRFLEELKRENASPHTLRNRAAHLGAAIRSFYRSVSALGRANLADGEPWWG